MRMFGTAVLTAICSVFSAADAGATRRLQLTPPAAASDQPDFSGRWILDPRIAAGPDVARTLIVRQVLRRTNFRGDPIEPIFSDVSIDRELEGRLVSESHAIGLVGGVVGGIVSGTQPDSRPRGSWNQYAVTWDGSALIFDTASGSGAERDQGPWTERREAWSLDDGGRLKIVISTRSSEGAARSLTLLYRRP
jgi:hypothetical protein